AKNQIVVLAEQKTTRLCAIAHYSFTGLRGGKELIEGLNKVLHDHGLRPHAIGTFFVDMGPGSFTGIRSAMGVTTAMTTVTRQKTMGFPAALPLLAACLDSIPGLQTQTCAVIFDGRRNEVLLETWTLGSDSTFRRLSTPEAVSIESLATLKTGNILIRSDDPLLARTPPDQIATRSRLHVLDLHPEHYCRGISCALETCPELLDPQLIPIYVRPPVFVEPRTIKPSPQ
ncbi:MAG: hypothetical protein D6820_12485, partial [Lentisphaerae bacterium]